MLCVAWLNGQIRFRLRFHFNWQARLKLISSFVLNPFVKSIQEFRNIVFSFPQGSV